MGLVDPEVADLRAAVLQSMGPAGPDFQKFFAGAYREIYPLWPLAMLNNVGFCLAAMGLGIRGENATFSPAADGAVTALAEAAAAVAGGRAAAALAGGVSEAVSPWSLARAHRLATLSPTGRCRPFDPGRDGTVPGEGGGLLVLEPESSARTRGAAPLAMLAGWSLTWDDDGAAGLARAAGLALAMAGAEGGSVGLIMAQGDGTPAGDEAETAAIGQILGSSAGGVPVLAAKAFLGHCGPGAPALDAVLATRILAGADRPAVLAATPARILVLTRGGSGGAAALVLDAAR
jgi:3-oxoacyl-[acyl-carrier-protein] synthase II